MVRNAPAEILAAKGSLDLPKIVKGWTNSPSLAIKGVFRKRTSTIGSVFAHFTIPSSSGVQAL